VLELGCGDGGNALSIAQALPGASVLGIDASPTAIERGITLARAAALENIELRCATFEALGEGGETFGPEEEGDRDFDYVLAHGVYSWVPPAARGALLDCVKRCLAPQGIAFVSYNAYPGSYLRDMARDMLRYHVQGDSDPDVRLARAQELMQTIVAIEQPSPFARVLREHMERMLRYSEALLFHDDLAEVSTPFYFHEFVEHAARHGLRFLSEADLFESQMRDLPESAGQLIASLPEDAVVREQYLDFFKNRMFRQTLLCHREIPLSHALDDRAIERLWISSSARPQESESDLRERERERDGRSAGENTPVRRDAARDAADVAESDAETFVTPEGFTMTTSERLVRAAMRVLGESWPAPAEFSALLAAAVEAMGPDAPIEDVTARLRAVLLQAQLARIVMLQGCPPPLSPRPRERPQASPLARAQLAAGLPAISSLLHANVRLEGELEPQLLPLLDGTSDMSELAQALGAPVEDVAGALERLASVGLLASDEFALRASV
jgi:SAM-dependent methyltransferase